ncbi:HAD-IIB family hydrolase [Thalassotalea euphylliae]|uniref:HAD-IIB family hydrolase n=1 Tax=Thalassotalea euphylliae TaxID=1655234 RepID=A0A3E0U6H1_9GAMM|nr:HAD-IIB family hydrolase [Thalassotalea euphylliae]REL31532.1 HAD-IIB family hydrolase [Thalassotalea euphylliae]
MTITANNALPMVFTDLDGTLLDHHNYSFAAAEPTLEKLKAHQIPVIATTSKTVQEVTHLYEAMAINGPFIVENGAAVYIPTSLFTKQPDNCESQPPFWVKTFSSPRSNYIAIAEQLKPEFGQYFTHFAAMSIEEIAKVTGLSLADAQLANQRQYGEPVLWRGGENEKHAFINAAQALGANILLGGRFIHLCDACDKGKAMNWLAGEYQHQLQLANVNVIALGDSGNDTAMLEAADIAVQIKSPTHTYPPLNTSKINFIYQTQGYGPIGWSEALNFIIDFSALATNPTKPTGELSHG